MGQGFKKNYQKTVGVNISHFELLVKEQQFILSIWDLAGEENLKTIRTMYAKGSHLMLYVLDLTREIDQSSVDDWFEFVSYVLRDNPQLRFNILFNKLDLNPSKTVKGLEILTKSLSSLEFELSPEIYYTSAITGDGVKEALSGSLNSLIPIFSESQIMLQEIKNTNNYMLFTFYLDDMGPSIYSRDKLNLFDSKDLEMLDDNLNELSVTLISSLGKGHTYLEAVTRLPTGLYEDFEILAISRRIKGDGFKDERIENNFMIFTLFYPKKFASVILVDDALEKEIEHYMRKFKTLNQVGKKDELPKIKEKLVEILTKKVDERI